MTYLSLLNTYAIAGFIATAVLASRALLIPEFRQDRRLAATTFATGLLFWPLICFAITSSLVAVVTRTPLAHHAYVFFNRPIWWIDRFCLYWSGPK